MRKEEKRDWQLMLLIRSLSKYKKRKKSLNWHLKGYGNIHFPPLYKNNLVGIVNSLR